MKIKHHQNLKESIMGARIDSIDCKQVAKHAINNPLWVKYNIFFTYDMSISLQYTCISMKNKNILYIHNFYIHYIKNFTDNDIRYL